MPFACCLIDLASAAVLTWQRESGEAAMRTFLVSFLGIVMATTAAVAVDSVSDEQAVRKVVADFNDAWNKP